MSGDCALLPCLAMMARTDVTVLLLPLNQVAFSVAAGTRRIGTVNPNLQAVANGASAGLILNPDPHSGVLLAQTLPTVYSVPRQWLRKTAGKGAILKALSIVAPMTSSFAQTAVCGE